MPHRAHLSLDGQWYFSPSDTPSRSLQIPPSSSGHERDEADTISVPAPWQADARFRHYEGPAWYQRDFDLPADWLAPGQVVVLGFGAVDYFAEVWLNGIRVGKHEGGYLPFELDITHAVMAGPNRISVRVDDPPEIFAEIPHGKQSWYGMLSGIWQSVWVERRAALHIQRLKITPQGHQVWVEVNLSGTLTEKLSAEIRAPGGEVVARRQSATTHFSIPVDNPQTWSPDEPHLYTLKVSTSQDEVAETFGFRTIEARHGKIWLNGRPFYLRAALDQDYYPDLICTPPSQEYIEDEFRKAKALGLNTLRLHIKIADPRYYAAADKVGLLIWTELPNHILLTDEAKRRARETLAGMVTRDGNHPSIGIWTIVNESWGVDLSNAEHRAWLAEMYDFVKALDPTRLVAGNSACWGNFNVVSDLDEYHMYFAMPDHYDQWRDWSAAFAQRPWWTYASEYVNAANWREMMRVPWRAAPRPPAPEARRRGDEPLLVSEFGNWGLPEIEKLLSRDGGEPWWFETGLEWGEGVVYPHGVENRFRQYAFDRLFPSLGALATASQHLQFAALKYEIEQMRRHPSIQGYVITELTDVHWECNGLLDMQRNPKAYFAEFARINADDVLIPLWGRLALSAGETCAVTVLFSHYSTREVENADLVWQISGDPLLAPNTAEETIAQGRIEVGRCSPFDVTRLGVVSFDVPHVELPRRARLEIRLVSGEVLIAATELEFVIFPREFQRPASERAEDKGIYAPGFEATLAKFGYSAVEHLSQANTAIVSTLDDACRAFMLNGGKVLFLAEQADALQTVIPGLSIVPRAGTLWQGDWASSFGWHRFESVPSGGMIDFTFAGLTPEHILQGFAPRDFAHNVYAGLFVGWLHKPVPTIARKRFGRGELLISTFRLSTNLADNPLATWLFGELLTLTHT